MISKLGKWMILPAVCCLCAGPAGLSVAGSSYSISNQKQGLQKPGLKKSVTPSRPGLQKQGGGLSVAPLPDLKFLEVKKTGEKSFMAHVMNDGPMAAGASGLRAKAGGNTVNVMIKPLASGKQVWVHVQMPEAVSGQAVFTLDPEKRIREKNEQNNVRSLAVVARTAPQIGNGNFVIKENGDTKTAIGTSRPDRLNLPDVDLEIRDIKRAAEGRFWLKIANNGKKTSGMARIELQIGPIRKFLREIAMSPEISYWIRLTIDEPVDQDAWIHIDPDNAVKERNERNNSIRIARAFGGPSGTPGGQSGTQISQSSLSTDKQLKPDLLVADLKLINGRKGAKVLVRNAGAAKVPFTILRIAANTSAQTLGVMVETAVTDLNPGQSRWVDFAFSDPVVGIVHARIDPDNHVDELNENNNIEEFVP